jgi:hypothetical protein
MTEHPDLKAALLGEIAAGERRAMDQHLAVCAPCREEWSRLESTVGMLRAMPDEEMPRRIAFVSDKVFEPRWWQRLWGGSPALGFASAAMLSAAIVTHAVYPRPVVPAAPVEVARVAAPSPVDIEGTVRGAVQKAVAEVEARNRKEAAILLKAMEQRYEDRLAEMRASVNASFDVLARRMANARRASFASADLGDSQ